MPKDWSFAYFSFLGVGKLILAGLSNRRCRWLFGYFWPVSTTQGKIFIAGVVDTVLMTEVCSCCKTISGRRSRPWPPILSLEQPWKRAKAPFGGLRGLWSRCVECFWMQLFMAVPMTPSAAVADFGGRRYRRFTPFNFLLSLAAPHGVVVTGDNCSPVSLSPAITLSPATSYCRCCCHRW